MTKIVSQQDVLIIKDHVGPLEVDARHQEVHVQDSTLSPLAGNGICGACGGSVEEPCRASELQEIAAYLREVADAYASDVTGDGMADVADVRGYDALHYDTLRRAADHLWPES